MDRNELKNMRIILETIKINSYLSSFTGMMNIAEFLEDIIYDKKILISHLVHAGCFWYGFWRLNQQAEKLGDAIELEENLLEDDDELTHKREL